MPTKTILFFFGCSEVNSTWLITSELAYQCARKVLFTCVVCTNYNLLIIIIINNELPNLPSPPALCKICNCKYLICLPTEHQGIHKNSFKNTRAFQDRIGIWKCRLLRRGVNRSTRRKTPPAEQSREPTTNSTHI